MTPDEIRRMFDNHGNPNTPITIHVTGTPQPQGSKQGFYNPRTRTVSIVEGSSPKARARFHDWRQGIANAARDYQATHARELVDDPIRITIDFKLPRPKSAPKKRRHPHTKPDIDKLARAVLDAITGTLITNDSRVCQLLAFKTYGDPPGATITIEQL